MFAKENKREAEKGRDRDSDLERHVWAESWHRYIRIVFCLGLSVFFDFHKFSHRLYVRYSVWLNCFCEVIIF